MKLKNVKKYSHDAPERVKVWEMCKQFDLNSKLNYINANKIFVSIKQQSKWIYPQPVWNLHPFINVYLYLK